MLGLEDTDASIIFLWRDSRSSPSITMVSVTSISITLLSRAILTFWANAFGNIWASFSFYATANILVSLLTSSRGRGTGLRKSDWQTINLHTRHREPAVLVSLLSYMIRHNSVRLFRFLSRITESLPPHSPFPPGLKHPHQKLPGMAARLSGDVFGRSSGDDQTAVGTETRTPNDYHTESRTPIFPQQKCEIPTQLTIEDRIKDTHFSSAKM